VPMAPTTQARHRQNGTVVASVLQDRHHGSAVVRPPVRGLICTRQPVVSIAESRDCWSKVGSHSQAGLDLEHAARTKEADVKFQEEVHLT